MIYFASGEESTTRHWYWERQAFYFILWIIYYLITEHLQSKSGEEITWFWKKCVVPVCTTSSVSRFWLHRAPLPMSHCVTAPIVPLSVTYPISSLSVTSHVAPRHVASILLCLRHHIHVSLDHLYTPPPPWSLYHFLCSSPLLISVFFFYSTDLSSSPLFSLLPGGSASLVTSNPLVVSLRHLSPSPTPPSFPNVAPMFWRLWFRGLYLIIFLSDTFPSIPVRDPPLSNRLPFYISPSICLLYYHSFCFRPLVTLPLLLFFDW